MKELELKKLWQDTNEKLEANFVLNQKLTEEITGIKIHSLSSSIKPIKILGIIFGILWVIIGVTALVPIYLHSFYEANKFFLFSASIQILLTAIALWIYLYQLIKIHEVNSYDPILKTQKNLVQLRISTLWSARILFLQLPVWTTFWWNETMFTNWNWIQWAMTIIITALFTIIAIWLFFNIKYENRNKKWFQLIFSGKEWIPLMKSMELLEQVEEYKSINKNVKH